MKTKTYGQFLLALTLLGLLGMGCSTSSVDPAGPNYQLADANGNCPTTASANGDGTTDTRKPSSITQDGKTYCFSSQTDRDRYFQAHAINSRY